MLVDPRVESQPEDDMLIPEGALLFALHPAVVDAALGRKVPQEVWGSGLMGDHPMTHVSVVNNHGDRFRPLSGWGCA